MPNVSWGTIPNTFRNRNATQQGNYYIYFGVSPNSAAQVGGTVVYLNNWHLTVPRTGAQRFTGLYHLTISLMVHGIGAATIRFYFDGNGTVLRFQREGAQLGNPLITAINQHIGTTVETIGSEFAGLITVTDGTDRIRYPASDFDAQGQGGHQMVNHVH